MGCAVCALTLNGVGERMGQIHVLSHRLRFRTRTPTHPLTGAGCFSLEPCGGVEVLRTNRPRLVARIARCKCLACRSRAQHPHTELVRIRAATRLGSGTGGAVGVRAAHWVCGVAMSVLGWTWVAAVTEVGENAGRNCPTIARETTACTMHQVLVCGKDTLSPALHQQTSQ